jgi:hypothetical protein
MRELLDKINEYGIKKTGGTLSLIIENDESGWLIPNIFDCNEKKPVFEFDSMSELYKELE